MDASEEPGRTATRADVARLAGVSTAVVSYVLTGARPVGVETEARVRSAIRELGYTPNRTARALRTGRSDLIGVVLTDVTNPYFAEFAVEIELAAAAHHRAVLIVNSQARLENEMSLIEDLSSRGVDALIIGSVLPAQSRAMIDGLDTPVVWIDDPNGTAHPMIASSMEDGSRELVQHLIDVHGLREVAIALGDGPRLQTDPREAGWRAALADAGLPEGRRVEEEWSRDGGRRAGRRLLGTGAPPQAIFACSDLIAVGVLRAAVDLGLRVPHDVALVSFDGTQESRFSNPPMTTLRQPIRAMARAAVDAALTRASGTVDLQFRGELVVRQSCGC